MANPNPAEEDASSSAYGVGIGPPSLGGIAARSARGIRGSPRASARTYSSFGSVGSLRSKSQ